MEIRRQTVMICQKTEPLVWPSFTRKTEREVVKILCSGRVNYWTGSEGKKFEVAFAKYLGVKSAVSTTNGTAALRLALEALGVGRGDEVIVTAYSFRASATAAANVGAKMVFADVGEDHLLNAKTIEKVITRRTKAVIVVHLYGQVVDLDPILRLAKKRKFFVIEDCAQSLGAEYHGRKVGSLGDAGCFSFCQSKHITTGGEGGMVVMKNQLALRRVQSLRDHGWIVGSDPKEFDIVGYNERMTEIQSAIGLCELERFEKWNLLRRRKFAEVIKKGLLPFEGSLIKAFPVDTVKRKASFWLMPFLLNEKCLRVPVSKFIETLQCHGANVYKIMWPLMANKKVAKSLIANTVGFWVHPSYTLNDIRQTIRIFREVANDPRYVVK